MANRVSLASLVQAAHAAGFRVATYSPGDGRIRYRFFRASEHPGEVDYFGSSRPVRTVSGAAAASRFIDEQREVQRHAAQAHTSPVLTAKKPTMADVKRANVEYHRRRGESWSFFDPGNKRVFGTDKFSGPYAGPGGVFFVVSNKAGTSAKRVEASGNIEHVAVDAVGLIEHRNAAKRLAAGARKRNSAQGDIAMWAREVPRGSIIRGVRVGALVRPVYASGKEIYRVPPSAIIAAGYRYDQKREAMSVKGDFHDFVKRLSALLHGSDKALTTPDFAPYL